MKKIAILIALTVAISGSVFAKGLWLGATALYNLPMTVEAPATPVMEKNNFWFGADATLELFSLFKVDGSILYVPTVDGAFLYATTDVGLSLNILFLNVGLGIGPNFAIPLGNGEVAQVGLNLKPSVGLRLGKIGVNLYGLYTAADFDSLFQKDFLNSSLLIGADVQIRLF